MGPVHGNPGRPKKYQPEDDDEETVEKTNTITLLLESDKEVLKY